MQSEVELMVEPSDEPIVKTDVNVSREDCQQRTIDILFEVKQTRVCIKKANHLFKDLEKTMEVSPKVMRVVEVMIEDWQELVKYHRKRTLTSMLNYDLVLSNKLDQGKHTYRIILETEFPHLERIKDDGFNDNEIGIARKEVSFNTRGLTLKDTLVTIDSATHYEDKVQLSSQASHHYHDTVRTLHMVKQCTESLQEMLNVMS
jgi:hypothetical protein